MRSASPQSLAETAPRDLEGDAAREDQRSAHPQSLGKLDRFPKRRRPRTPVISQYQRGEKRKNGKARGGKADSIQSRRRLRRVLQGHWQHDNLVGFLSAVTEDTGHLLPPCSYSKLRLLLLDLHQF